jgi:hypothetical protein
MILKNFIEYQIKRILHHEKVGDNLSQTNFGTNIPIKVKVKAPKMKQIESTATTPLDKSSS